MSKREPQASDLSHWASLIQRLARKGEAPPRAGHEAHAADIFAARAAAFGAPDIEQHNALQLDLIAFDLGGQRVAIEARYIHAVVPPAVPTPVPGLDEILAGVINFRGDILPVFRLERLLGVEAQHDAGCTIVLGEDRPEFGFFAQSAEEVTDISESGLTTVPWQNGKAPAALGISQTALNVLDGRALLSDPQFHVGRTAAGRL